MNETPLYYEHIISNKIKCNLCGDIIESKHVHDFRFCNCKSVAVDGGKSYRRRIGNVGDWQDLSEIEYREKEPK